MEATGRLVALIRKYRPEVMTAYDPFGDTDTPTTSRCTESARLLSLAQLTWEGSPHAIRRAVAAGPPLVVIVVA